MWILSKAREEFGDHPHAVRTWVRGRLPWFLIDLGLANFGADCESLDAQHNWCNIDNVHSRCIFCGPEREGQLWRKNPYAGAIVWHDLDKAVRARRSR
ncbi:MAG TPA: hypothetical protein VGW34_00610 [Allosphingosinicella sp.]|nr:hypothetical protein [Allosphingosinicella sp.]